VLKKNVLRKSKDARTSCRHKRKCAAEKRKLIDLLKRNAPRKSSDAKMS
jgi:hypothetical protein